MGFGYLSAAIIALIVLLAFKKYAQDRARGRGGALYRAFRRQQTAPGRNRAARAV